jgi:hypothetical protein
VRSRTACRVIGTADFGSHLLPERPTMDFRNSAIGFAVAPPMHVVWLRMLGFPP